MKVLKIKLLIVFFAVGAFAGTPYGAQAAKPAQAEVKNVIFMIGDGMGLTQMQLAMMNSQEPLAMERAQYIGLAKTFSANNRVTDSAAAGTALSTGTKTNNGFVGVDPQKNGLKNLIERSRESGLATGVVVTKDITDATPAAFLAHQPSRKLAEDIALDVVASDVDLFIGGGRKNMEKRQDGVNLSDQLRAKGYTVAYTIEQVQAVNNGKLAAMLADGHLPTMVKGRGDFLPLATAQALKILTADSKKGFFMMVEGSQIDSGGHANDAVFVQTEALDFDNAVRVAFDFADRNPGTLVVVTADHETGGLTLPSGNSDFLLADQGVKPTFGTGGHSAVMVPVYAYGTGAANFTGVMDNTDLPKKIAALLGLK